MCLARARSELAMMALKIFWAVLLVYACSLGPGLLIVRRFRSWWPLERLVAAVGLSLFVLYLAGSVIYGLGLGAWAYYTVSLICLMLLALCVPDLLAMLRNVHLRRTLLWMGLLQAWCLAALAMIRHYSGGGWHGDWIEHFERCLFFLGQYPADRMFLRIYPLPARPPMMNVLGAFVMAQAGMEFPVFQVVFLLLNSLIFLPCVLLASSLMRGRGRRVGWIAVLFAVSPIFIQNVTYTWTKLLGGFYTVLAVWVYLRALRKNDAGRLVLAVALLAIGMLVHYSVAVFIVVLAVHYFLFEFWQRQRKWREVLGGAAISLVILATWLGWSIQHYGWRVTFASNTAVTSASPYSGWGNVEKIASNILHTVVPHPFFDTPGRDELFAQSITLGYWRDYTFLIYQTNVIVAMGCLGGIAILALRRSAWPRRGAARGSGGSG